MYFIRNTLFSRYVCKSSPSTVLGQSELYTASPLVSKYWELINIIAIACSVSVFICS